MGPNYVDFRDVICFYFDIEIILFSKQNNSMVSNNYGYLFNILLFWANPFHVKIYHKMRDGQTKNTSRTLIPPEMVQD